MPIRLEIPKGKRYGNLTVIKEVDRGKRIHRRFLCECVCGNVKDIALSNLSSGNSFTCGCGKNPSGSTNPNFRHGLFGHKLYWVWHAMKRRCSDKNNKRFARYGGRGIEICEEWKNNPSLFMAWAFKNGYKPGLTLDRRNNNKKKRGYSPENCRFVTQLVNNHNK